MSADHDIKAIILANAEGRLSDEAAQAAIEGVIVDSSRKSTLSAKITSSHWIILFDARRGEHCLNRAFEVAAAVDAHMSSKEAASWAASIIASVGFAKPRRDRRTLRERAAHVASHPRRFRLPIMERARSAARGARRGARASRERREEASGAGADGLPSSSLAQGRKDRRRNRSPGL